jgi:hypothetical protein
MPVLAPGIPFPTQPYIPTSLRYNPLYILLQRLSAGDQVIYFDQNSLQSYRATVTSISKTLLVLNVPNLVAGPVVNLNISLQDYESSIPVMSLR